MSDKALIHAVYLRDGVDTGRHAVVEEGRIDEPIWLHFNVSQPNARAELKKAAPYIDDAMVDALCAEDTRPRVEEFEKEYLVILRGINLNPEEDPEDMVSLRIWSDGSHVVSAQRRSVFAARKLAAKLQAADQPASSSEVIVGLTVNIIENMAVPISELMEEIDELELEMIDGGKPEHRTKLANLRHKVLLLRRYFNPLRAAVGLLKDLATTWLGEKYTRRLRNAHDDLTRHLEDLDAARDRLQFQQEELVTIMSDRLNRNMYTLSIVAAIFLPLGFITGLFGINVGGMPGVDDGTAFWVVTGGCGAIAVVLAFFFRRSGWF
ncbi:zinc transporter ZntB [Kordiimonas aestuarii]|uniref:zinc transporter ZntB n=1 Tax=Kordiimonas aestuarii TaxID=1005925 RepID=UPI0021CEBBB3|nr:zinc transporter ZntB [Kordiimonas aestuarii]